MLFIKSLIMAIWKGLILGVQIGSTVSIVVLILAICCMFWIKVGKWCERQIDPDNKAYKPAPKEPVKNIMKTNKWNMN